MIYLSVVAIKLLHLPPIPRQIDGASHPKTNRFPTALEISYAVCIDLPTFSLSRLSCFFIFLGFIFFKVGVGVKDKDKRTRNSPVCHWFRDGSGGQLMILLFPPIAHLCQTFSNDILNILLLCKGF